MGTNLKIRRFTNGLKDLINKSALSPGVVRLCLESVINEIAVLEERAIRQEQQEEQAKKQKREGEGNASDNKND